MCRVEDGQGRAKPAADSRMLLGAVQMPNPAEVRAHVGIRMRVGVSSSPLAGDERAGQGTICLREGRTMLGRLAWLSIHTYAGKATSGPFCWPGQGSLCSFLLSSTDQTLDFLMIVMTSDDWMFVSYAWSAVPCD